MTEISKDPEELKREATWGPGVAGTVVPTACERKAFLEYLKTNRADGREAGSVRGQGPTCGGSLTLFMSLSERSQKGSEHLRTRPGSHAHRRPLVGVGMGTSKAVWVGVFKLICDFPLLSAAEEEAHRERHRDDHLPGTRRVAFHP